MLCWHVWSFGITQVLLPSCKRAKQLNLLVSLPV